MNSISFKFVKQVGMRITLHANGSTGVGAVKADGQAASDVYDLGGRRTAVGKGIYIIGGKKKVN